MQIQGPGPQLLLILLLWEEEKSRILENKSGLDAVISSKMYLISLDTMG